MYEIQEYRPGDEKAAIALLVIVALLVAVFSIGYMLGIRNAGAGVHDNGNGIEPIRNELGTAAEHQREITSGLEGAVAGSHAAAERAGRIEEAAVRSEAAVGEAGRLIDECQQTLGRIRNRGQAGKAAH